MVEINEKLFIAFQNSAFSEPSPQPHMLPTGPGHIFGTAPEMFYCSSLFPASLSFLATNTLGWGGNLLIFGSQGFQDSQIKIQGAQLIYFLV